MLTHSILEAAGLQSLFAPWIPACSSPEHSTVHSFYRLLIRPNRPERLGCSTHPPPREEHSTEHSSYRLLPSQPSRAPSAGRLSQSTRLTPQRLSLVLSALSRFTLSFTLLPKWQSKMQISASPFYTCQMFHFHKIKFKNSAWQSSPQSSADLAVSDPSLLHFDRFTPHNLSKCKHPPDSRFLIYSWREDL